MEQKAKLVGPVTIMLSYTQGRLIVRALRFLEQLPGGTPKARQEVGELRRWLAKRLREAQEGIACH